MQTTMTVPEDTWGPDQKNTASVVSRRETSRRLVKSSSMPNVLQHVSGLDTIRIVDISPTEQDIGSQLQVWKTRERPPWAAVGHHAMITTWRERPWSRSAVVNGDEDQLSQEFEEAERVDSPQPHGKAQPLSWLNLDAHNATLAQPPMPSRPPPPPPLITSQDGSSRSRLSHKSDVDPLWARNFERPSRFVEHLPENRWRLEKSDSRRRSRTHSWFSSLRIRK